MNKLLFRSDGKIHGDFTMKVYRKGKLIETYREHNLIVNDARESMAHLITGDVTGRSITKIAFGTSGTPPTPDDTVITNPYTKNVTGFAYPAQGQVQINWELTTGEDNGVAIMEFGLLCANGKLFARKNRNTPINKDSDISIDGQWLITF